MSNSKKNSAPAIVPPVRKHGGFTLVVTLSLMVLLTVIAVGLLGLSAISLRSSSQEIAQSEARANARLALMLAIGELQKQMGPDQRISAPGAIVSETAVDHPHWTGVWNSWKAGNEKSGGDATSEHSTIAGATNTGMAPTYEPQRKDHFRTWLLSLDPAEAASATSPLDVTLTGSSTPGKTSTAVELVGNGSLGATSALTDSVRARLLEVKPPNATKATGRYAWWVGDESQKARVMEDSYNSDPAATLAEKIFRAQAPGSTGTTTVKGLEKIKDDAQLKSLASLKSLDLVNNVTGKPAENFHHVTPFSYQVLADVREGGLKRDLSTLLERPIDITENQDPFMLYRFDNAGQERVPIQDLAAYYQLYDSNRSGWREGMKYSSPVLDDGIQVTSPDFGNKQSQDKFLREYTKLYRSPVPIKIQMVVSMKAEKIPDAQRDNFIKTDPSFSDTHFLRLGIIPSVSFWNPTNVAISMNLGDPESLSQMLRLSYLPFYIRWKKSNGYTSRPVNLSWAANGGGPEGTVAGKPVIFSAFFSGEKKVVFQPGEIKVFSFPYQPNTFDFNKNSGETFKPLQEMVPGWDATAFLQMGFSAPANNADDNKNVKDRTLTFKGTDSLAIEVGTSEDYSRFESAQAEVQGAGMQFFVIQKSHQSRNTTTGTMWNFRNYQFVSRMGSGVTTEPFNASLMKKGFPGGTSPFVMSTRTVQSIIDVSDNGEDLPFIQFALMAGSEISGSSAGSGGKISGRKFASRPFLHSSPIAPPFIDKDDKASLYNYGWNWWVDEIGTGAEASVETNISDSGQGYYGGGYTALSGTNHVTQQEIPLVPPLSIASLSHAHLGGFSLSNQALEISGANAFQKVTAVGYSGLFPHTLQAVGNSYAHPNIPAEKAYSTTKRFFNANAGEKTITIADHSYLANKALWDDFFFSSISPQQASAQVFGNSARTAKEVATDFFSADNPVPLPNRRIIQAARPTGAAITQMFTESSVFGNGHLGQYGLADKIASHLMVEGAFNVNSTSVEAWKIFLSSLKGKPVSYFDKDTALTAGVTLEDEPTSGTPVSAFSLPNGKPHQGSSTDTADPNQWASWRELTSTEIEELATAMVKQVKLRGPFLSLSDFVNRRLDPGNTELTVKGALQAALDDVDVSINEGFRSSVRKFSSTELSGFNAEFPEALEGPVAYGSSAYIDQADVLRNFAAQLTPRGDTFVIRTYGDSLDASGNVTARAWCEAVVQRIPDYVDTSDEPYVKQANLGSNANKLYGRKFNLVKFRWLNSSEV